MQGRVVPDSRKFGLQLVEELVVPHIRRRLATPTLQTFIKEKCRVYLRKWFFKQLLKAKPGNLSSVLRVWDVYSGSWFLSISDPGWVKIRIRIRNTAKICWIFLRTYIVLSSCVANQFPWYTPFNPSKFTLCKSHRIFFISLVFSVFCMKSIAWLGVFVQPVLVINLDLSSLIPLFKILLLSFSWLMSLFFL